MQKDSGLQFRRRASAAERSRLLSLYRSSRLTQAGFASQHGINVHTLRQWLYRGGAAQGGVKEPEPSPARLQEVSLCSFLPSPWAAEVALPSGASVRFHASASPELVRELFAQLSAAC